MMLIWITLVGALGVVCRHGLDIIFSMSMPWGTLAVNVLGSFLAGLCFGLGERALISANISTALLVGFCGGFTTFSAYSLQSMQMINQGKISTALIYFVVSPPAGLTAAFAAAMLVRKLAH